MTDLLGCRCVITGASGALGQAITREVWERGATVFLAGRNREKLELCRAALTPSGAQRCHVLACDLESPSTPAAIVDESVRTMGGITALVNNAAVQGPIGNVWEIDWLEWERAWRVNLLAAVDLSRRAVPAMAAGGRGKIVSISGGGATAPRPRFSAYGASKAALVRFSETLAREVASCGIDVNCIAPGALHSAMTEAIIAAGPEAAGSREYGDALQVRDAGDAVSARAAALCAFLLSEASDGITGRLISAVWDPWPSLPDHLAELRQSDIYTLRRIVPADRGLAWGQG